MIKIERPEEVPRVLREEGVRENDRICREYSGNPGEYQSGKKKLTFDGNIYGHHSVKETLLEAQHSKCCYCERKFKASSYGAVEHFRPKGASKQSRSDARRVPGYYWLAFEWDNLLVSCEKCNTSYKGSLFPLRDPGLRVHHHGGDLGIEEALFIDPSREDPREHVRFRREAVEALTPRGLETIEGMGLRRSDLEEARKERLDIVELLQGIHGMGNSVEEHKLKKANEMLELYSSPQSEFSAMVCDFLEASSCE